MLFKPLHVALAGSALAVTLTAPILFFFGIVSLDHTQRLLLLGTVLWMAFASRWMVGSWSGKG